MPEISIIIPNYNTAKYLPRCLDSLIHQTFRDIEIIVIDDGSTDNSLEILKGYQDHRIRILSHQGDGSGPGGARNMGLQSAHGKYIMFCDSDDWYEPNMCQKMYETIEQKKVDLVCCQSYLEDEEGLSQKELEGRHKYQYYNALPDGKLILTDKRILKTNVLLWNKIWRRDLIKKYQISLISKIEHEDDAFWLMYGSVASTIYYLKDKLYHYFLRRNSIMSAVFHKTPKNPTDRYQVCLAVYTFLNKNNLLNQHKEFIIYVFRNQLRVMGQFLPEDQLKKYCESLNKIIKNDLKSNKYLVVSADMVSLFDRCDKIKLWYQLCVSYFKKHLYSYIKKKKCKKYEKKIQQLKIMLKSI